MLKLAFINELNLHQTLYYVFIVISSTKQNYQLISKFDYDDFMLQSNLERKTKLNFPQSIKIMQTFSPHFFSFNFIK